MSGFVAGVWTEPPACGCRFAAGGVVPGASFVLGLIAPGPCPAAPAGAAGVPFTLGTGSALAFGSASGARVAGSGLAGGAPGLIAGFVEALSGIGSFPCWMSVALCAAKAGRAGVTAVAVVPPNPGRPLAPAFGPGWGG